jgi:hypothetical protein
MTILQRAQRVAEEIDANYAPLSHWGKQEVAHLVYKELTAAIRASKRAEVTERGKEST